MTLSEVLAHLAAIEAAVRNVYAENAALAKDTKPRAVEPREITPQSLQAERKP